MTIKEILAKGTIMLKSSNIDVEIMNLAGGEVFYRCPKTHSEITLESVGDTETVDLDLLMTMKNRHKGFLWHITNLKFRQLPTEPVHAWSLQDRVPARLPLLSNEPLI